jgi:phosphocarrier protein
MTRASQELEIVNKLGLHARAAAQFVSVAGRFTAAVDVERGGNRVNGKSIMGVMMLAASQGTRIRIEAEGEDAEEALAALAALVTAGFHEPE